MVLITTTRRDHLELAIDQCGGVPQLAKKLGIQPETVYGLRSGSRNVGHQTARRIEAAMGWDDGAMDVPLTPEDKEIAALLRDLPESEAVKAIADLIPDLSPEGVRVVSRALLRRVSEDD